MIAIINYGLGNLRSVAGAIERLGYTPVITNEKETIRQADKLVLPGVGAFGDGIKNLKSLGLESFLTDLVCLHKKPVLGICLGFQLMAKDSDEFGYHEGLGWIDASVKRLDSGNGLRVPHVGWNDLFHTGDSILTNIPETALFYYTHSYHVVCKNRRIIIGECNYGINFCAAIQLENIVATQFHPEKSQYWGLQFLDNFLRMS